MPMILGMSSPERAPYISVARLQAYSSVSSLEVPVVWYSARYPNLPGSAHPIDAEINSPAMSDAFLEMTAKAISPGLSYTIPDSFGMIWQSGGTIELTITRFKYSIPASRSANANDINGSECRPTPSGKE